MDGNDVDAVQDAAARAVARIRTSGGPAFLELATYRQRGHFEPDDQTYVDPAELRDWLRRDPIRLYVMLMVEGVATKRREMLDDFGAARVLAPVIRLTGPDAPAAASWVLEQAAIPTAEAEAEAVARAASDLVEFIPDAVQQHQEPGLASRLKSKVRIHS